MHINIVLFQPEIPQNTGNISRTCSVTGSTLHLVGPLGFSLGERHLRRAGLDYWDGLDIRRYPDTQAFFAQHGTRRIWYFSQKGLLGLWDDDALAPDFSDCDSSSSSPESVGFRETREPRMTRETREPEPSDSRTPGLSDSACASGSSGACKAEFVTVGDVRDGSDASDVRAAGAGSDSREGSDLSAVREPEIWLAFGCESRGLDEKILLAHPDTVVRIPMLEGMRSLNLSNAVAIAVYEVLRRTGGEGLLKTGRFPGRDDA